MKVQLSASVVGVTLLLAVSCGAAAVCAQDRYGSVVTREAKREARVHHDQAVYLANCGRIDEAIKEDRQAIGEDPTRAGYQILMARLLTDAGQLEEALSTYERVCKQFPETAEDLEENVCSLRGVLGTLSSFHKAEQHSGSPSSSEEARSQKFQLSVTATAENAAAGQSTNVDETGAAVVKPHPYKPPGLFKQVVQRFLATGRPIEDPVY